MIPRTKDKLGKAVEELEDLVVSLFRDECMLRLMIECAGIGRGGQGEYGMAECVQPAAADRGCEQGGWQLEGAE
jgi:hypothetical protein